MYPTEECCLRINWEWNRKYTESLKCIGTVEKFLVNIGINSVQNGTYIGIISSVKGY